MEVYLVRHTTPAIAPGTCYGRSDIPVDADLFPTELAAIRAKLPADITQWYSSPLQRCMALAQALHPQPVPDARLQELDFGSWENRAWSSIPQTELDPWMSDFVHAAPPTGESFAQLHTRTEAFVEALLAQPLQTVGIVTHAGPIRSLLCRVLGLPLENAFRVEVGYGAVVRVKLVRETERGRLVGIFQP